MEMAADKQGMKAVAVKVRNRMRAKGVGCGPKSHTVET